MLFLDTETTGVDQNAELLSITIVDEAGEALLNTYLKPRQATQWPDAMRINGLTPEFIFGSDFPYADEVAQPIRAILADQDVCAYNVNFDMAMLANCIGWIRRPEREFCAMHRWAIFNGVPSSQPWHPTGYRTEKLTVVADKIGYQWTGKAHGSHADTLACQAVWQFLDQKGVQSIATTQLVAL